MSKSKYYYSADEHCVLCRTCIDMCVGGFIDGSRKPVYIDRERCIGCGSCAGVCDHHAIKRIYRDNN